jgi:ribose transport system substrate-binding protein
MVSKLGLTRVGALLGCAVALLIAGCGSSSSSSGNGGGGSSNAASSGGGTSVAGAPSWCGSKKMTLALADGFGDNNWRRVVVGEARNEASKCPSVTKFDYTDGQGNTQKAISDIHGLVAQGVNAMVVFPDAGEAVLPALEQAFHAGVVTVPYRVSPGGSPGSTYNYFISTPFTQAGVLWGQWVAKVLHGSGNVANLGGPPANSQSLQEYQGMESVLKNYPNIHFVGQTPYNVTDWDPAKTQQVVTALLAKYPKIDAITTDFGAALDSAFGAFKQAGRQIPAVATEDANALSCDWQKLKSANPNFKLFTVDSQTWMVRTAIDFAVAKASGGQVPASPVVPQKAFEDSVSGQPHPVQCVPALPRDAFVSSHLSQAAQIKALGGA